MEEKILIEGKFNKSNVLAIVSGMSALITLIFCIPRWQDGEGSIEFYYIFAPCFIFGMLILAAVFYFWMSKCRLTITDKRVYGKAAFGKRVDLPLDMISATTTGLFKSVTVATSSGRISFWLVKNRDEVFDMISKLLIERQSREKMVTTTKQEAPQSNADELKKYKELMDSGIITQEEFDAKKKQLLGL